MIPLDLVDDPDTPGATEVRVDATVAGRTYRLILDTGGARSALAVDDLTSTFASPSLGDSAEPGRGVLGPGGKDATRAVAPSIVLGPIEARDVVIDLLPPGSEAPPILGLDVLGGHRLDVRLADATLGIDTPAEPDRERPLVLSSRSHPYVDIRWGEVVRAALFDTGASVSVIDSTFATEHPELIEMLPSSVGIDSAGVRGETPLARLAACEIGGRAFAESLAAVLPIRGIQRPGDPEFDVILGVPLIRQADWIVDLKRSVWGFRE